MGKTLPPKPSRHSQIPSVDRALIRAKLDEEVSRLRRLEAEQKEAKARVAALRGELGTFVAGRIGDSGGSESPPRTPLEKVTLFRQLFRGREDLYPTRFVSKKTGKAGYAPACSNKFVAGLCELPTVKCGDCKNHAFYPVDDDAILRHLQGKQVNGVYPMLPDETCWFLAADFDKSSWADDVRAFAETARGRGLPVLVERSRSGNGAHVWFFFSEPVPAATARKMACHLITETMASRHELSMDSYDRLFPSQDTMPRGGFGNLIALPLQHGPRQRGNSVFVDERLEAYPDDQQWSVLASVRRIDAAVVERIAAEATRSGGIVGVPLAEAPHDGEVTPWMRTLSGAKGSRRVLGPLPARVSAILAQQLFIVKDGVPSPLLNQIKRLAAFQNPEFYKRQSMRLSTAMIPRVISCANELPGHVALPRGCRTDLEMLPRANDVALDILDERVVGAALEVRFQGSLTTVQESAAAALLAHDTGVFVAPPGIGKCVIRCTRALVPAGPEHRFWHTRAGSERSDDLG